MNLRFELPALIHYDQARNYIEEFTKHKSKINGSGGLDIENYEEWVKKTLSSHRGIELRNKYAPASTYFVFDEERETLVGMVNIRHTLTPYLVESGSGHIGYSVRPTERRKGYAKEILRLALLKLKEYGVKEALLGCYKENIGSRKTIEYNRGIFQKEICDEDGKITRTYIIRID
jgi:predicted acetyltransferase